MAEAKKTKEDYNIDFDKIRELISDYEEIKKSGEIKHKNETETRESFISPLFKALGWNTENRLKSNDSVSKEENIAGKRSDYGFRINGIPKFFLEAKSLKEENIEHNSKYVTQAIDYAWMKSCSLAILCNFETIAVYNADWKDSNYWNNILFVFHPSDFLTNPHFKMLSKESFEKNELDTYAKENYKKQLKYRIDKQLLQDMIHFREILSKDIVKNNQDKHLTQDDIDESVQRILDRLIFIRNAEDRGLEENQLQSIVRQWYSKGKGHLMKEISRIYADYDRNYNSKLFAHHLCDDLYMDNEALQEVIEGLNHSKDNSYRYDFSIIESDVLGNIYEQYLGNILKSTPKRAKLEESKTHRKEQGIYYTPSYIVDYIVKNTVGEYIKTHTPEEIKKVRILDPACGSGSFLIRAYKELENYWLHNSDFAQTTLDSEEFYSKKVEILKNNIFGVDLDPKAVEIAQLNLLLQISERKQRLPILQNNIKVGNSLIDDPFISDKAFKWEGEFSGVMKEGGFDIIISNPPYLKIEELPEKERKYYQENYSETYMKRYDAYALFTEKGVTLLKEGGIFGMIIPSTILNNLSFINIRKFLINSTSITKVVNLGGKIFKGVNNDTLILILKKQRLNQITTIYDVPKYGGGIATIKESGKVNIRANYGPPLYNIELRLTKEADKILTKMNQNSIPLGEISNCFQGLVTGSNEAYIVTKEQIFTEGLENKLCKPVLFGDNVSRYVKPNPKYYVIYVTKQTDINSFPKIKKRLEIFKGELVRKREVKLGRQPWYSLHWPRESTNFECEEKIVVQCIRNLSLKRRIVATLDTKKLYADHTLNIIYSKNAKYNIKYVLGILNSKLINYLFQRRYVDINIKGIYLKEIPIRQIDFGSQLDMHYYESMIELVNKILNLNDELQTTNFTDKRISIEQELALIDRQIDNLVYDMYGLDKQEREIVNASL